MYLQQRRGQLIKSVARDSWCLKLILKYLQNLQNISFPIKQLKLQLPSFNYIVDLEVVMY